MRILLVGEFSGVHNNLKYGLMKLGHQVVQAADGDGYRGFKFDVNIKPFRRPILLNNLLNTIYLLFNIHNLCGYDIVQFISPFAFPIPFLWLGLHKLIFRFNKVKLYYVCGGRIDASSVPAILKYYPNEDTETQNPRKYSHQMKRYSGWFIRNIDMIVPSMYVYGIIYRDNPSCLPHIKLPVVLESAAKSLLVSDKLRILHGVTRSQVKGSSYIIPALQRIEKNFSNYVAVTVVEKLPYADYIKVLESNDILVDQCRSYSYGMNALIAMSKGLIVLSGAEPEAMEYLGVEDCPVINIIPDENQIYEALAILITDRSSLHQISKRSLSYVTNHHDAIEIAQKFEHIYRCEKE